MLYKDDATIKRVFSQIDQDELVHLAMALADVSSPTGREQEIANFVLSWFEQNGFYTIKQEVERERYNAIAVLKGTGGGPSLTINGHLDTVLPSRPLEKSYLNGDRIYGNEIANMKASLAAFMTAAKAIKQAKIQLRGDLILATVVGEISTAAIWPFQESQERGEGFGTRYLLANGVQSDYAIVADGSEFAIVRAQAGVAYFKITIIGPDVYTPFTQRTENIDESQNVILKMTRAIDALENWAREYERRTIYKFSGGQVEPKVVIAGMQAGMPSFTQRDWREPFRPSRTPPSCDLYLDVRLPPGMSPLEVKHELERLLSQLPFECRIEMFRSQRGYEGTGAGVDYLCSIVEKAYKYVFQSKPPPAPPSICSMWTDTNLYWEIGIPAVKWGPSETLKYPDRKTVEIPGLVGATKIYSLIALEVCGEGGR